MTEGERFNAYLSHFHVLCNSHEFVRLLKASNETTAVRHAMQRLEPIFAAALDDIAINIDAKAFQAVDCNALARVQLASGLIWRTLNMRSIRWGQIMWGWPWTTCSIEKSSIAPW